MVKTVTLSENYTLNEVPKEFEEYNIKYFNIKDEPFRVYGLLYDKDEGFVRLPKTFVEKTGERFAGLYRMDAGGRVRFKTNSRYLAIKVVFNNSHWVPVKMSETSSCGFDVSIKNKNGSFDHAGTFENEKGNSLGFQCLIDLYTNDMKDLVINFPIFAGVKELMVGIDKNCKLEKGSEYRNKKPIVFYGSSITHGAFASRPSCTYEAVLSNRLDLDYINMGFSGACKAEPEMMEYLSNLEMSAFVLDYDYNAWTEEYLESTHYNAYKTIRDKNPNIPIVMASRPNYDTYEYNGPARRNIIKKTFDKARKDGDNNVYFVDGKKHFSHFMRSGFTVDMSHPNDGGFLCMANAFEKEILKFYKELT